MNIINPNIYNITAKSFENYLLLNGWERDYNFKNKNLMVFTLESKMIAIPASEKFEDFYIRVPTIIKELALIYHREFDSVVRDIIAPHLL